MDDAFHAGCPPLSKLVLKLRTKAPAILPKFQSSILRALFLSQVINMQGNITAQAGITINISLMDWGNVAPGTVNTKNFTVTNVGNVPLTLSFTTSTLSSGLIVDYAATGGASLPINATKPVMVTLTVSTTAPTGVFSYTTQPS